MSILPPLSAFDSSLALLREGYAFISNRCDRLDSDVFATRLFLQPTLCLRGQAAVELFYREERFTRVDAAPRSLRKTLFGEGGVQGLDGAAHRQRKALFLEITRPARVEALITRVEREWRARLPSWQSRGEIILLDELHRLYTRAVCDWAGVTLAPEEEGQRCTDLVALLEGAGSPGLANLGARRARRRLELWLGGQVEQARKQPAPTGSALALIAQHREPDGQPLSPRVAAVELLNVLRPTVAVARFSTFAALALYKQPAWRERLRADPAARLPFAQEVRRFYAFFPFTVARVRETFEWHGVDFRRGTRVLLDLYGTNRDPRSWERPEVFEPTRFVAEAIPAAAFVPQGGGDVAHQHRCPGEGIALALMTSALRLLLQDMTYQVPTQDLRIDLARMPMRPASGLILSEVQAVQRTRSSVA
ncbi:cytochrome P450 [Pseudomonas oryzihabitans]|uniref:cytochrome P450 n=1 Tax=Pseudomonas oryzihabitans TaxID=47885 RepID=UPI00135DFF3D|nr:cytochrome P450 [Pseudomonas oryzihabitans]MXS19561.1 cytochrome P450 [Pseudomonas oryzihabitans]